MSDAALPHLTDARIAVIGLGYVGLPLAAEFGKSRQVVGFDIDESRIAELRRGEDRTRELSPKELDDASLLQFSNDPGDLEGCDCFIVTVPTPLDLQRRPDLGPLLSGARTAGRALRRGGVVIFESTVYPGATEEDCVPVLEHESGLSFNRDFYCGYSPERINPGDRNRRLPMIVKITSGSTPVAADFVDRLYGSIITAGTHRAPSIKVAEAAKVIENTQRDLNIALVNELAMIFNRMEIDTEEVLEAAGTKWNFLPFRPGLVGGHCIGVDPYYLTAKAEMVGCRPEVILAGRRTNDAMAGYAVGQLVKAMIRRGWAIKGARVLVMGATFKENCPDLRNSKVIDLVGELRELGITVDLWDPLADPAECAREYGFELQPNLPPESYHAIVLAVAHDELRAMGAEAIRALGLPGHIVYDLKYILPREASDLRL